MTITRIPFTSLPFLKTIHFRRPPPFFDIASREGNLDLLEELPDYGLAIVGSRTPQRKSHRFVEEALSHLKHTGLIVISGFAKGIDSIAHESAIRNGLRTVALVGAGIDVDYPRENQELRKRILETGGLIISAFERGTAPRPAHFDLRNSLIAAFSKAVWVVEAAHGSGTLNTAKWTTVFNRDLYATPAFPGDPDYQGNEKLLSQRDTRKNPIAHPFYGSHSLEVTWSRIHAQRHFPFSDPVQLTLLQQWVKDIKGNCGECFIQNLMDHALVQGLSPGEFYRNFQRECDDGHLIEDEQGRIDLRLRGQVV